MLSIAGYEWGWDNARALLGILLIYRRNESCFRSG